MMRLLSLVAAVGCCSCLGAAGALDVDAGAIDAGAADGGAADGSVADAGSDAGGPADAAVPDAGVPDAGAFDAGPANATTCAALGLTSHQVDIPWPLVANSPRVFTPQVGTFGADDAIVVRFKTPAGPDASAALVASEYSIFPVAFRVATLSATPCVVATAPGPGGLVLATTVSATPVFYLSAGPGGAMYSLNLSTDTYYYVTYVNRTGYGGISSCDVSSCSMYIDFNN